MISVIPLNSVTEPRTRTPSPTWTSRLPGTYTKTPSEVAASPSPTGACTWKPFRLPLSTAALFWKSPTTTPSIATSVPASGLAAPLPCTVKIGVVGSPQASGGST